MPELPEVESVRRSLDPVIGGLDLIRVRIGRRDVVRDSRGRRRGAIDPTNLGVGSRVTQVDRRGKQLVIRFENGSATVVRLGMSGRLEIPLGQGSIPPHRHVIWTFGGTNSEPVRVWFVDPRRFGGVHLAQTPEDLTNRLLAGLGPEAPHVRPKEIADAFGRTQRATKIVLLDQRVIAGIGNIYADEALHQAGIHPARPAADLDGSELRRLCGAIRKIMDSAIKAGGSTLRDHRLPDGSPGGYRDQHRVYGREGASCPSCETTLEGMRLGGRSTTYCPQCQRP
ncbi:MAG: formamidopyrimidine-DNA glycosylase [Planctomycetaceae bacterium]|nr:formamidopyrimidine-DNA glycosylase [Planctomycetaceae bacterium]